MFSKFALRWVPLLILSVAFFPKTSYAGGSFKSFLEKFFISPKTTFDGTKRTVNLSGAALSQTKDKSGQATNHTWMTTKDTAQVSSDGTLDATDRAGTTAKPTLRASKRGTKATEDVCEVPSEHTFKPTGRATGKTTHVTSDVSLNPTSKATQQTSNATTQKSDQSSQGTTRTGKAGTRATGNASNFTSEKTDRPTGETSSQATDEAVRTSQLGTDETEKRSQQTKNTATQVGQCITQSIQTSVDKVTRALKRLGEVTNGALHPKLVRFSISPSKSNRESTQDYIDFTSDGAGTSIQASSIAISMNTYYTSGTSKEKAEDVAQMANYGERRKAWEMKAQKVLQGSQSGAGAGIFSTPDFSGKGAHEAYSCRINISNVEYVIAPGFFSASGTPTYFFLKVLEFSTAVTHLTSLELNPTLSWTNSDEKDRAVKEMRDHIDQLKAELLAMIQEQPGAIPSIFINIGPGTALVRAELIDGPKQ